MTRQKATEIKRSELPAGSLQDQFLRKAIVVFHGTFCDSGRVFRMMKRNKYN